MPDPTGAEIAAHLRAGGTVEWWWHGSATWCTVARGAAAVADAAWWDRAPRRDVAHPGCRLVPLPSKTERVPLWDALRDGRKVLYAGEPRGIVRVGRSYADGWLLVNGIHVPIADDGTVEVLREQT